MLALPGYQVDQLIYESASSLIYRGLDQKKSVEVLFVEMITNTNFFMRGAIAKADHLKERIDSIKKNHYQSPLGSKVSQTTLDSTFSQTLSQTLDLDTILKAYQSISS